MKRKDKELMLIHAFGLNVGSTVEYEDYLGRPGHSVIIEIVNKLGEECLMLKDQYDNEWVIEDIIKLSYAWNHYFLYDKNGKDLDRKDRQRIAFKLLDIHIDDKIAHNGTIYTCREFGDEITLYNSDCGECWPVDNLYRLDNWEKVNE